MSSQKSGTAAHPSQEDKPLHPIDEEYLTRRNAAILEQIEALADEAAKRNGLGRNQETKQALYRAVDRGLVEHELAARQHRDARPGEGAHEDPTLKEE